MSRRAWSYIWLVMLGALALSLAAIPGVPEDLTQWLTLLVLIGLTTGAHLSKALGPSHEARTFNLVFLFAGLLLLHPLQFVLLVIVPHAIEWAKERLSQSDNLTAWYGQPFNISVHILAGFAAYRMLQLAATSVTSTEPQSILTIIAAAVIYVMVNHLLVGSVLVLARGVSWRESGVFDVDNLITDQVLTLMGYTVAVLWNIAPLLALLALAPLVPVYRALSIPQLKREARTDAKTGLWNAQHIINLYHAEIARARRMNRGLAVIMADLDLLRNINNTYGHLAGDTVLAGVGQIIRNTIRQYDMAGRFGGEEFFIVLPEATPAEAEAIAERLRQAVETSDFLVHSSRTPIHATLSLGVACFPTHASVPNELIHKSDVAVYFAKLQGRNRVVLTEEVPDSFTLGSEIPAERLKASIDDMYSPRPETPTLAV
jgi:diguanylate cyclase (GGDEF)-like protein